MIEKMYQTIRWQEFTAAIATLLALACSGCQQAAVTEVPPVDSVEYISADEFAATVGEDPNLVLVEFCVPSGCFRCDDMKQQIDRLADKQSGRVTVRRVNFNHERGLTNQFGITVCPTYVAFLDGQEVYRAAYPTSADLIFASLDPHIASDPPQSLAD